MSPTLILQNAAVPAALIANPGRFGGRAKGDLLTGDLLLHDGRLAGFLDGAAPVESAHRDLAERILLPRLAEAHCHLDKCHSIARLAPGGGDLMSAIDRQKDDSASVTEAELRRRGEQGLRELLAAGCTLVRSHVDWDSEHTPRGEAPLAWRVLHDLAADWADRLSLQRAALLSLEHFDDESYCADLATRLVRDDGVLGVFVYDQDRKAERLHKVFALAERHGLALDFHVDEGLDAGLDGLASIAEVAIERGFRGPVLCGHACSLMNVSGDALRALLDRIAAAGLAVVSLPSTNLYLQGRNGGATPERRGITRLRELRAVGVPVAIGSDNVGDAFCPLGSHDPMANLQLAALVAHLDPPYGPWLSSVTSDARRALGVDPVHCDGAAAEDLLLVDAGHSAGVVAGASRRSLIEFLQQEEIQ